MPTLPMPCFGRPTLRRRRRSPTGFTLIELMIVVAVVALLATVALPSYLESVRKSRRADAITALQTLQQAQERWRAQQPSYTTDLRALRVAESSPAGHYTIAVSQATATGYTATAVARPGSAQAGDTRCAVMRLEQDAGDLRYRALDSAEVETGHHCWGLTR